MLWGIAVYSIVIFFQILIVISRVLALTHFCSNSSCESERLNRRDKHSGVNAAVTFDSKDAVVEAIGTYLRRVTEVFATAPAASNKHQ